MHPMPTPAESPVDLEFRLTDSLLDFERLDAAWPKGATAIERARIGREREEALAEILALRSRIATAHAETLADAAAQLRRLAAMTEADAQSRTLLALPDVRRLVASVLAVVERAVDGKSAPAAA